MDRRRVGERKGVIPEYAPGSPRRTSPARTRRRRLALAMTTWCRCGSAGRDGDRLGQFEFEKGARRDGDGVAFLDDGDAGADGCALAGAAVVIGGGTDRGAGGGVAGGLAALALARFG